MSVLYGELSFVKHLNVYVIVAVSETMGILAQADVEFVCFCFTARNMKVNLRLF
jgi:hypothetical protein